VIAMAGPSIQPPKAARSYNLTRLSLILLVLALVAAFYFLDGPRYLNFDYLRENLNALEILVHEHLLLALFVFILVYVAVTTLPIPLAAGLSILAGALFGRWLGTGIVSVASTISATLAFLGSRFLFHDWVARRWNNRLQIIQKGLERDGAHYLFMLRLVPFVPFFLINLGMGLSRIRLRKYVLVSWVGMLPLTFLYCNAGQAIDEIQSPRDVLSWQIVVSLVMLGIAPWVVRESMQRLAR
jgi:uncharacterized membrane protein YdjX (TVP38/TMEM64 family)